MELVLLFGSRGRGDFKENSYYDVSVVGDEVPRGPRKVPDESYLRVLEISPGEVDLVFMNTEAFLGKLRESRSRFR